MALDTNDITIIRDTIIDAIEQLVLPRFDEHDRRFDEHDRRFDAIESDIKELKSDVSVLKTDVSALKNDMRQVKASLERLEGRVEALEADIKEIYLMQAAMQRAMVPNTQFAKLSLEKKLLKLNADLLATAKEAGIALPR